MRLVADTTTAPGGVKKILDKADKNKDGKITFGMTRS